MSDQVEENGVEKVLRLAAEWSETEEPRSASFSKEEVGQLAAVLSRVNRSDATALGVGMILARMIGAPIPPRDVVATLERLGINVEISHIHKPGGH